MDRVKCKDCPHKKEIPLDEQIADGAPEWMCSAKHSDVDDIVCLMRMQIWLLDDILDSLECEEPEDWKS